MQRKRALMSQYDDPKSSSQERFGARAQVYVQSAGHAKGHELDLLVEMAQPQPGWLALDIATGGGHTALKFAPRVRRMIATDLTHEMLLAARQHIDASSTTNVSYAQIDAEMLAFPAGTFDLITSRIAPHHFADPFRFVQESARTLKPGGLLLVQDLCVPEDDRAARYLDAFERLRDPSHARMYAEYEWRGMFLDAGLTVEVVTFERRRADLVDWAAQQDCPPDVVERLHILLRQMPAAAAEWIHPRCAGTPEAAFDHVYIIIMGRNP